MVDTLRHRCLLDLVAALDAVSTATGYRLDVARSAGGGGAHLFGTFLPRGEAMRLPFVMVYTFSEQVAGYRTSDKAVKRLNVRVAAFLAPKQPRKDEEGIPLDLWWDLCDAGMHDVERAIMADPSRGGVAQLTEIVSHEVPPPGEQATVLQVETAVAIQYLQASTDPTAP